MICGSPHSIPSGPMDNASATSRSASSADPTIELRPGTPTPSGPSGGASAADSLAPKVQLVEGTSPELTRETEVLLRSRLRLASTILSVGFAVFLVRNLFQSEFPALAGGLLFGLHTLVTVALGTVTAVLFRWGEIRLRWLRWTELVVFGFPLAFFVVLQHVATLGCCEKGYFEFQGGPWLVLIFTYALFIPNSIRRASVVIGIMAAMPIALMLAMFWSHPAVRALATVNDLTAFPLMLVLAAGASVFGVDTIGFLRREAHKARRLGQYHLTRRIGAGGMGEVYLAEHQLLKRPCVIKLILPGKAGDERILARFQREVRATAKLSHWNTVEIFDYGSTDCGTFYYVMEYLPGMSLLELVDRFGPLPAERVIYLLRQACDALGEAHGMGLIHRDIKPGNIFAAKRGGVYDVTKVLDFGLVKPLLESDEPVHLTVEGAITGSPLFMSPEQATGDGEADARSDIYSLGAVGYYLLTGRPPFEGDKPLKVLMAHARDEPTPPSERQPGVPADLEAVILRCLAKRPEDRYQTAAELEAALAECEDAGRWNRHRAAEWWESQEEAPAR